MENRKKLTLGSLFDGSGGFPLAGILAGIEPKWSSEVEPFPIRVTTKRLPGVKHYGDVSQLSGAKLEPVDIITFGSPCQDMSIAGKRVGLNGERSGLFHEAIRIIKEMREATEGRYPRYCVWENVCFGGDTLITCDDGYRRIADIAIGQRVKTLSGKYLPVMKVHQTKHQEVLRLSVLGGQDLTVTPNHPFYARRKIYKGNEIVGLSEPEWVPAHRLTKEYLIAYGIDQPTLPDDFITEAEAWAVGRWIADGSVDLKKSNPRMFFSIGKGKEERAREMLNRLPYEIYENKPHPTATNFCFTSHQFYALIAEAGKGAGQKRVPPYVFRLPFHLQKLVLEGYLSGDGYARTRKNYMEITASTASRELAYGIARLMRNVYRVSVGISARKLRPGNIQGREIKPNYPCYQVYAYPDGCGQRSYADEQIVWQPVKSIEYLSKKQTVYNLSVLEDNTYAANDVIVHNCGAFSSNNGEDFKAVLEEIIGIKEPGAEVPAPDKNTWPACDVYVGGGWSVAYAVLDAQRFGVPQRRKRIYLVADFADECAGKILFESAGLSGYSPEGFEAWKRVTRNPETGVGASGSICLSDQGGERMDITEEVTTTLRAEAHHPPVVLGSAGFCTEHSADSRSIGYEEEKSPTLRAGIVPAAIALEHNPTDSRIHVIEDNVCQTLCSRMGTGGNNVPLIMTPDGPLAYTLKIRCGGGNGGKGALWQEEKSATLATNNDQTLFQPRGFDHCGEGMTDNAAQDGRFCAGDGDDTSSAVFDQKAYGIGADQSYGMLSDNPHAGIYEAETSRTLDAQCGYPGCAQGGVCVVESAPDTYDVRFTSEGTKNARGHCYKTEISRALDTSETDPSSNHGGVAVVEKAYSLQGNMIGRADENGPQGKGVGEDVAFTLTGTDQQGVAAPVYSSTVGSYMTQSEEVAQTLMARDYKDPQIVNTPQYIVRRLTPVECARLQAFPDWWCDGLETPEPTEEDITFWTDVFETHRRVITGASKPKTRTQIIKWLQNPYRDSAVYRMYGNGIAASCAWFVLAGIVYYDSIGE